MKASGASADSLGGESLGLSPRLLLLGTLLELFVGLWLISGIAWERARWAGIGLFALLGVASLYLALTGQVSCHCFGAHLHISPWLTFSFDLVAVVALWSVRPAQDESGAARLPRLASIAVGIAAIGMVAATDRVADWLGLGERSPVHVSPRPCDLGRGQAGETKVVNLRLTNVTDQPIKIVGGTSNCVCNAALGLPLTLEPSIPAEVTVALRFTGERGRFQHIFALYTSSGESNRTIPVAYTGIEE